MIKAMSLYIYRDISYVLIGYVLNYVILIIHFSYHYSMWDFTHTCILNNLLLTCESLPLCGLQDFSLGHKQVLLAPPYLMGFFLH